MSDGARHEFLRRALSLAARGGRSTAPNPRVGAVVVSGDEVVGEGWHERAGGAHAEIRALEAAGDRARGATLFASLEPCTHEGRTPPCTDAIIAAGIRRVSVALIDPDPRVRGRGVASLSAAGLEVELADEPIASEARRVVEDYLVHRARGRAFAALKVAGTLDGRIADRHGCASFVTGETARAHGKALRERYGGIIVGVETVLADDPQLLPPGGSGDGPFVRAILDRRLRTPSTARLFEGGPSSERPVVIYAAPDAPKERRAMLARAGAEIVTPGAPGERTAPVDVLSDLARRDVLGVIVEGGGVTHGAFLETGTVDKLYWYLAPAVLGDPAAVSAVHARERSIEQAWRASIANVSRLGDDVLLTLYPREPAEACSRDS